MTDLKPGIYKATVRGECDTLVILDDEGDWSTITRVGGCYGHDGSEVTDARPLVLLDLESIGAGRVAEHLRRCSQHDGYCASDIVADQIEAQTKPPRIPEPGRWRVVEAGPKGDRRYYVRELESADYRWNRIGSGENVTWSDLIDPVLKGVES